MTLSTDASADAPPADAAPGADKAAFWRVALLMAGTVAALTLSGTFAAEKLSFFYKDLLHLSAGGAATLAILLTIPQYCRPLIGAGSDLFPLFGYHRRSYYALASLLGAAGYFGLSRLAHPSYWTTALLVIVTVAGGATLMIMADTVMVAVGNRTGTVGRIQAVQQFLPLLLSFTYLAHLSGYVTQHWSYAQCFGAAALAALLPLPLTLLMDETRVRRPRAARTPAARAETRAETQAERARTVAALRDAAKSPGLWATVAFVFYLIFTPGTNTALFYYKVDTLHFSKQLIGDLGKYSSAGAMLGIAAFALVSRRVPMLAVVLGAWLLDCSLYALDFAFRDALSGKIVTFSVAFFGIVYTLCLFTLAARACPPQIAGTVYGLFIASISLAGSLGEKVGSTLYDRYGPAAHHSAAFGWYALNAWGLALTLPAGLLIFFLPAWAKSRTGAKAEQRQAGAA